MRVFAVGPKFDLSWVDTREHYRAHLVALMDASQRGRVPASVQRGAADVRSRQLGGGRDLIALPEDVGLMTAFVGSRGAPARRVTPDTGDLTAAIGTLLVTYSGPAAHYTDRYPHLARGGCRYALSPSVSPTPSPGTRWRSSPSWPTATTPT